MNDFNQLAVTDFPFLDRFLMHLTPGISRRRAIDWFVRSQDAPGPAVGFMPLLGEISKVEICISSSWSV